MSKVQKKKKSILPPILVCLVGICAILYLPLSDLQNTRLHLQDVERYESLIKEHDAVDTGSILEKAKDYNKRLSETPGAFKEPTLVTGYATSLSLKDSDVMAYIEIPKIDAKLPIYHGTDEGILGDGIGHLEGSSLPVGGESTHSVLVGHRGLSTASLFTRLDEMKDGDLFMITVLGEKLYYQVDQIVVVEPDEIDELQIVEGKDYCTLLTCTPFGINTHRLLVRGIRIPAPRENVKEVSGYSIPPLYTTIICTLVGILVLVIVLTVMDAKRKKKKQEEKEKQERG